LSVADAALSKVGDILQRQRELAVQANSDALSANEQNALQSEFNSLNTAIDDIAKGATFNGLSLLTGATGTVATPLTLQIGAQTTQTSAITVLGDYQSNGANVNTNGLTITGGAVGGNATNAQNTLDTAIQNV